MIRLRKIREKSDKNYSHEKFRLLQKSYHKVIMIICYFVIGYINDHVSCNRKIID